jgi:hypothetical protein
VTIEFKAWDKIPRLYREMTITEKLDGTNAAVGIQEFPPGQYDPTDGDPVPAVATLVQTDESDFLVYAQSRTRLITPEQDNFGFASWVVSKAPELVRALGAGLHYGEWWGSGIQRGYGLLKGEKRFSLFNVNRYRDVDFSELPGVGLVPILYQGMFSDHTIQHKLAILAATGSQAAPGFMDPEGIVIYHSALNGCFKVTIKNDEAPKGAKQ